MKITTDTNILVRAATQEDPIQGSLAQQLMKDAAVVAVPLPALCEFCRVLKSLYKLEPARIAASLRALLEAENVTMDRPGVESGLALLEAGGDFVDGIIAYDGQWLDGETFVSFDMVAMKLLAAKGVQGTRAEMIVVGTSHSSVALRAGIDQIAVQCAQVGRRNRAVGQRAEDPFSSPVSEINCSARISPDWSRTD